MKLELKHFNIGDEAYGASAIWTIKSLHDSNAVTISNGKDIQTLSIKKFQVNYSLIKHPLSDLTKEIEVDGEKFVPIVELCKISDDWGDGDFDFKYRLYEIEDRRIRISYTFKHKGVDTDFCDDFNILLKNWHKNPYWANEKLLEWGFDLYNLIKEGSAIDINTLK